MVDKHANMPGMQEPPKASPSKKETSDKPQDAEKAKPAPTPAPPANPKHEH